MKPSHDEVKKYIMNLMLANFPYDWFCDYIDQNEQLEKNIKRYFTLREKLFGPNWVNGLSMHEQQEYDKLVYDFLLLPTSKEKSDDELTRCIINGAQHYINKKACTPREILAIAGYSPYNNCLARVDKNNKIYKLAELDKEVNVYSNDEFIVIPTGPNVMAE
jgi:hypothetical protein